MRQGYGLPAQGFTLIELLTTIGIIAILTSVAAPSFTSLLRDTQRTTSVNGFLHALYLARSEALRNGRVVSICKSPDGSTCMTGAQWHEGWIVFDNRDRDEPPKRDPDERILLVGQGWRHGTITSSRVSYSYRAYQQAPMNGTIVFCDERGGEHARSIIVNSTGRARIARRDSNNRPLSCPTP